MLFWLSFPQGICWCRCSCSSDKPTPNRPGCSLLFRCHSRRESAGAVALVRPTSQHRIRPSYSLLFWLSFPQGICWCRCSCSSYKPTPNPPWLLFALLVVIPAGNLLVPLHLSDKRTPNPAWLLFALLFVIPAGNLLVPSQLFVPQANTESALAALCSFGCHSRRESAGAVAVVRPTSEHLIRSSCSLLFWLSFPQGICWCRCTCPTSEHLIRSSCSLLFWLSFPQGICWCRCTCPTSQHLIRSSCSLLFWLSFPQGICWCRCTCSSYKPTPNPPWLLFALLVVIPAGNLLVPLQLFARQANS